MPEKTAPCRLAAALIAAAALLAATPPSPAFQDAATLEQAAEPTLDERLAWIASEFEAAMHDHHAPGAALAVIKDGEVVLMRGFGVADTDSGRDVTADTRFAVGSTTKAFTATLIGMLADDGLMSFDEKARTHLPMFRLADPTADEQVTIRDLLCHRAGFAVMNGIWYGVPDITREEVLSTMLRAELLHPFRSQWNYSNESFLAAGMAAANAAGSDWDTLIENRIFDPLGMADSNTTYAAAQADPLMAKGYQWDADRGVLEHQPMRSIDAAAPAGSINSSVRDMSRWVIFQLGRGEIEGDRLLSEEMHAETWKKASEMTPTIGYGLGWMIREWQGRRVIEHAGGIDGFTAEVAMLPDEGIGMVMLTNQFASPLQDLSRELAFRGMTGDIFESAEDVPAENFDRFVGNYIANFGPFQDAGMEVLVQNGRLAVDVPGQMIYELHAPDEDGRRYFSLTDQIAVRFNENEEGEVYSMTFFQGGATPEIMREGREPPIEIDLGEAQEYLGVYRLEETGEDITVALRNNRLAVDVPGQMVFELHAPDDEGWRTFRITDTIRVRFDRDDAGEVVSLTQFQNGAETVLPRTGNSPDAGSIPTVEDLIAAAEDARWLDPSGSIQSLRVSGRIRAVHMGLEGTETSTYTSDGRTRVTVDLGRGRLERVYVSHDGGLSRSNATGDTELTGTRIDNIRLQNPLQWKRDWRESFDSVAVAPKRIFEGREVWQVVARLGEARATMLIDAGTWLPVALESSLDAGPSGTIPITVLYDDWRDVRGLLIAHRIELRIPMAGSLVTEHDEVEVNVPVNDPMFIAPLEAAG